MQFDLKSISAESVPKALEKAERYRLLGEPSLAESICLDILAISPSHQQALISLLLARTDQFGYGATMKSAEELFPVSKVGTSVHTTQVSSGSVRDMRTSTNTDFPATRTVITPCTKLWDGTNKPPHSGHPETMMLFCVGTPVRACSCGIRRFAPCLIRSFNLSLASSERVAEIFRHFIDEAMDGCLRNPMAGNHIHGSSQGA